MYIIYLCDINSLMWYILGDMKYHEKVTHIVLAK